MPCGSQSSWRTKLTFSLISPSIAVHLDPPADGSEALFMLMSVCGWCLPVLQTHWLNSTQSSPRLIGIPFLNKRPCVHPAPPPPISIPASESVRDSLSGTFPPKRVTLILLSHRKMIWTESTLWPLQRGVTQVGTLPPIPTLRHLRPKLTSLLCQPPPSLASFPVFRNPKAASAPWW